MSRGIHLRAILQGMRMNLVPNMCSEITRLTLLPHLIGDNVLMMVPPRHDNHRRWFNFTGAILPKNYAHISRFVVLYYKSVGILLNILYRTPQYLEVPSALLSFRVENSLFTGRFPSQKASDSVRWWFLSLLASASWWIHSRATLYRIE